MRLPQLSHFPKSSFQGESSVNVYRKGFTLIELLFVIAVLGILMGLAFTLMGSLRKSANLAQATSDIRQLSSTIILYTVENDGDYPVGFPHMPTAETGLSNFERAGHVWYEALGRILYPEIRAANTTNPWMWRHHATGFQGTIFWSPSAEPESDPAISSYAYNDFLYMRSGSNRKFPLVFSPSETVVLADGTGRTHSLNPTVPNGIINARHGASSPGAGNGQAIVSFLDGRTEVLSAAQVARYNDDPAHKFWGVRQ